jgi:hypothetical protein
MMITCDCSPDAKPEVREADKLPAGRRGWKLFVYCHECKQAGQLADTGREAVWLWENAERMVVE